MGVHPHDARECSDAVLAALVSLSRNPEVRAWGEIGLDFNRMYSPREEQEKWFVQQLETAAELGLPLIFHERDSGGRFLALLRTCPPPAGAAVIHCFSGTRAELANYLDLGYYIGITGYLITVDLEHFRDLLCDRWFHIWLGNDSETADHDDDKNKRGR